ncbi:MAG TPA: hypothetical protein VFZ64_09590 [Nocardioidaceae bacterium]
MKPTLPHLRCRPRRLLRRGAPTVAALVAAPLALSACAGYPAAEYARTSCEDLSTLFGIESPSPAEVELHVGRAAARARRAADLDGAFDELHADLRLLRDDGRLGATDAEVEQPVERALAVVGSVCADLGVPVGASGGALSRETPAGS